ncbi:MAG: bifunctional diaminohydroxyphosphoribosylaminopyrimidine deaminase/5-amino-6-(5-phosphoribosylamino)uracil reductase RibD [Pirellulales bacterium]|nr:bifunctional diaminohydroxyphosphoribosylaminopyrimidine deaminase/5-amino-6-(5-phosphoribosylamino)uracil reductase RibD [Pirellulales bacterium]
MPDHPDTTQIMARAIALARNGEGHVEPNPMVGCLILGSHGEVLGEGWHQVYGGPHAEVEALRMAGDRARGATMFVSLEPCCHTGKTPPCTDAIIRAGLARVVIATVDPFPQVAGQGIRALQNAGISVQTGIGGQEARDLLAPYIQLTTTGRPWVIAKWAMTLDGKIATCLGESRWISNEASRAMVHRLRGRMDAIMIGRKTACGDNPMLTARPPGPRIATRIVLDTQAALPLHSNLVRTAREVPVLVATGPTAPEDRCRALENAGVEVLCLPGEQPAERLAALLGTLGQRRLTNLLIEGGSQLLGSLLDASAIDEVHAFVAGKLLGGVAAPSPVSGAGIHRLAEAPQLDQPICEILGSDLYIHGRIRRH